MTVKDALLVAKRAQYAQELTYVALIEEFDFVASYWFHRSACPLFPNAPTCKIRHTPHPEWRRSFLVLAVRLGLQSYVQKRLDDEKATSPNSRDAILVQTPLLQCALGFTVSFPDINMPTKQRFSPSMVEMLLKHGADPNGTCTQNGGESIWQRFLRSAHTGKGPLRTLTKAHMMEVLLHCGANPDATFATHFDYVIDSSKEVKLVEKTATVAEVIKDTFSGQEFTTQAASLSALLEERQAEMARKDKNMAAVVPTSRKRKQSTSQNRLQMTKRRSGAPSEDTK
ncbi:hypothetical protein F5882DRAFT_18107 [Hyaloscypha sp. PMI_1271]|nr:hypothetical protein F5882DRAFT_18107 [Hyaloscypha sp. PMI_1271]